MVGRYRQCQALILLTHTDDARRLYYGERALTELQALGEVRLNETGAPLTGDALVAAAQGARIIVADRAVPAPATLFAALPDLIAFCRGAVDIRTVDVAAATAAGVLVTRASPGFVPAVCELIVGLAIDLCRGVSGSVASYRAGVQPPVRMGRQIRGSTVGIIGHGAIGCELARLMRAFGATVLVADPYAQGIETVPLAALLARSDLVVCLAVANQETAGLMNAAAFATMPAGSLFINASRGELVDDAALADALDRGHLGGAALDVGCAPDQMPAADLARRPDVLATPHIGGLTRAAADHQALETVRQVASILSGTAPEGAVNAAPLDALTPKSVATSSGRDSRDPAGTGRVPGMPPPTRYG